MSRLSLGILDTYVTCQWYIGQLSVAYQSCVNLAGESKREQVSDRPARTHCVVLAVSLGLQ